MLLKILKYLKSTEKFSIILLNSCCFVSEILILLDLNITIGLKLHGELTRPRENGISLENLEDEDIIILGDEAHHFNASTKKEKQEETSWENTINKMLYLSWCKIFLYFTNN